VLSKQSHAEHNALIHTLRSEREREVFFSSNPVCFMHMYRGRNALWGFSSYTKLILVELDSMDGWMAGWVGVYSAT